MLKENHSENLQKSRQLLCFSEKLVNDTVFNNISKSVIEESRSTPTVFVKDQNAMNVRKNRQTAKNSDDKSCRVLN